MIANWDLYRNDEEYQKNLEGSKALNTLFGHNTVKKRDKRNQKDVDAFNKKFGPQGITLIPDSVGEQGQKRWKPLEDVQGKSILSDEQLKRFGTRTKHSELRKDLEKDYPSDGSNRPAGTDERLRTSEAFAEAALNNSIVDKNQHTVAGANALASNKRLIDAAKGQSPSKGSIGKNLLTLQKMREEQKPVVTPPVERQADATKGVPTLPDIPKQQMNLNLEGLNKASATRIGNMQSFMNNASPRMLEFMKNNTAAAEDLLRDAGKGIGVEGGGGLSAAGVGALGKLMVQADPKGGKEWTEPITKVNTSNKGRSSWRPEKDPFAELRNW